MSAQQSARLMAAAAVAQRGRLLRLATHPREAAETIRRARRIARIGSADLIGFIDHVGAFGGTRHDEIAAIRAEFHRSEVIAAMQAQIQQAFGDDPAESVESGAGLMLNAHAEAVYTAARMTRPETIVETGVASGVSTTCILAALAENGGGHLYSFDLPDPIDAAPAEIDPDADRAMLPRGHDCGWLVPDELRDRWTLTLGPSLSTLPDMLPQIGAIDIFLHDSLHTYDYMAAEFRLLWPTIRPGGMLLSDDAHWNAAFEEFAAVVGTPGLLLAGQRLGGLHKPATRERAS